MPEKITTRHCTMLITYTIDEWWWKTFMDAVKSNVTHTFGGTVHTFYNRLLESQQFYAENTDSRIGEYISISLVNDPNGDSYIQITGRSGDSAPAMLYASIAFEYKPVRFHELYELITTMQMLGGADQLNEDIHDLLGYADRAKAINMLVEMGSLSKRLIKKWMNEPLNYNASSEEE